MKTYISKIDNVWYVYGVEEIQPHQVISIPERKYIGGGWRVACWNETGVREVGTQRLTKKGAITCAERNGEFAGEYYL